MKLDDSATCSAAELAWLLGCTDRAIRGYLTRGLAIRAGKRGRYALCAGYTVTSPRLPRASR